MLSSVDMWNIRSTVGLLTRWLGWLVGSLEELSPFFVSGASVDCLSLACCRLFIILLISVFLSSSVVIEYCERSGPVVTICARDCFWCFLFGFSSFSGAGRLIYQDLGTKR